MGRDDGELPVDCLFASDPSLAPPDNPSGLPCRLFHDACDASLRAFVFSSPCSSMSGTHFPKTCDLLFRSPALLPLGSIALVLLLLYFQVIFLVERKP